MLEGLKRGFVDNAVRRDEPLEQAVVVDGLQMGFVDFDGACARWVGLYLIHIIYMCVCGLFEEREESPGEGVEFVVVGDGLEREAQTDKAVLLGNGGIGAIGVGEDGEGIGSRGED